MIKCPNCGGVLKFNVPEQVVKCDHCGSTFNPSEKIATTKTAVEENTLNGKVYSCTQCGANLMTFDETAITFCSYCGSQAMIESKMMVQNNPDFIIPFSVSKEDCMNTFKKKVNKSLFTPKYLQSDLVLEKFRGIYIPYTIFKLEYKGPAEEKGSEYSHRSGDYVYYNDYKIKHDVDARYEGFSYDLVSKFYDKYSEAIPFDESKKVPFNQNYMLGFYADTKDVEGDLYLNDCIDVAKEDYQKRILSTKEISKYDCKTASIEFDKIEQKIGMFPLYFLAIRNKNNRDINYAVVNGQTGELVTELPVSYKKYLIVSLIVSAIIFVLVSMFLFLTATQVCIATIVLAVVGLIINITQADSLRKRETNEDDKGLKSKKNNNKVAGYKTPGFTIFLEIIAIVIPFIVFALNVVDDIYYYGASVVALGIVLITFYSIVTKHNELTSSKLPQLEKRGGDLSG